GGRVLIGCDNIQPAKGVEVSHRITLWDTATGAVAHEIALPAGLPVSIDASLSGRYLAAVVDGAKAGRVLTVWRLDGTVHVKPDGLMAPAPGRARPGLARPPSRAGLPAESDRRANLLTPRDGRNDGGVSPSVPRRLAGK